jgi:hypothetical protein
MLFLFRVTVVVYFIFSMYLYIFAIVGTILYYLHLYYEESHTTFYSGHGIIVVS